MTAHPQWGQKLLAAMAEGRRTDQVNSRRRRHYLRHPIDNRPYAVMWRQMGFATVPLWPRSKTPWPPFPHNLLTPDGMAVNPLFWNCRKGGCGQLGHGFYDASTDVAWAEQHWSEHPDHGIGVRPDPGVAVFDVDNRYRGHIELRALEREHGPLPETMTVISGRGDGGRHIWLKGFPGPLRTKLCKGVDILTHDRNAVVVPPTLHANTGLPYTFQEPVAEIADAPAWLVEMAAKPEPRPRQPRWPSTWRVSPGAALHRCRGLIDAVEQACDGERHNVLLWAACRAAEDGLLADEEDPVYTALADAAEACGLEYGEIHRVLRNAIAIAGQEDWA